MVHRLENWQLAINIMRTDPDTMREMINSAFEMANLPHPESAGINDIINKCKWTMSQDGLEMCITVRREDLLHSWIGKVEELPEFEEFLKQLDSLLYDVGFMIGQKHQLYSSKEKY